MTVGRRRLTIRSLLVVTGTCAVLLGIWKALIVEPATHQILAYEKAPSTTGLSAIIGPNQIRVQSIARNTREGRVELASGEGLSPAGPIPGRDLLVSSGPWLDVCQFEIQPGPDRVEIIEARIFDHATRTLLTSLDPAFGWRVLERNLLQVYGLGKEIPPVLDVWLRVHSYVAADSALRLPCRAGATAAMAGGTLTVREIQKGFAGWNSSGGFLPVEDEDFADTAMVLEWNGEPPNKNYQVAALTRHGEKHFHDRFLSLGRLGERRSILVFDFPLEDLDSIEVRPHGGQHRFFYEAVRIPPATAQAFGPPPTARVLVDRAEADVVLAEWAPLHVRMSLLRGEQANGSRAADGRVQITFRTQPQNVDSMLTLIYYVGGLPELTFSTHFEDPATGQLVPQWTVGPRSGMRTCAGTHQASAHAFSLPIEQVEVLEITAIPP